jgi:hypothetical protein
MTTITAADIAGKKDKDTIEIAGVTVLATTIRQLLARAKVKSLVVVETGTIQETVRISQYVHLGTVEAGTNYVKLNYGLGEARLWDQTEKRK